VCEINKSPTGCTNGCYDLDGQYQDGCECCDDGVPHDCASALGLGSIDIGGTAGGHTGKLPDNTKSDWYAITFYGWANTNKKYHPMIQLTQGDPGVVFEVRNGCSASGPLSCQDGTAQTTTLWETYYGGSDPANGGDPSSPGWQAMGPAGGIAGPTVYIRVFRANGNPTCNPYTLTITNQ
jgi:hypothetical protein